MTLSLKFVEVNVLKGRTTRIILSFQETWHNEADKLVRDSSIQKCGLFWRDGGRFRMWSISFKAFSIQILEQVVEFIAEPNSN